MKLVELFLKETTEEDRAIISLATAIHDKLRTESTRDDDIYDFDDDEESDDLDISSPEDNARTIGKIGNMFDTPLEVANNLTIDLQTTDGINDRIRREQPSDTESTKVDGRSVVMGLWYSGINTIVLNSDYMDRPIMQSVIAHELRHALDDYKSDYAVSTSTRYSTPKDKEHRRKLNDPYRPNMQYLAQPSEINARFAEVLNALVPKIKQLAKVPKLRARDRMHKALQYEMEMKNISGLFKTKNQSPDYKRLLKRGADFIDKEIDYVQSNVKPVNQ